MAGRRRIGLLTLDFARRVLRVVRQVESFRITGEGVRFSKSPTGMSAHVAAGGGGGAAERPFPARIVERIDGHLYACAEVDEDGEDVVDGRSGAVAEITGHENVPPETIVWIHGVRFRYGLPDGEDQYKVLQLDANNHPQWDFVRAH